MSTVITTVLSGSRILQFDSSMIRSIITTTVLECHEYSIITIELQCEGTAVVLDYGNVKLVLSQPTRWCYR
eukprot:787310-Pyramimonas_sp.AAC.1